MSLTPSMGLGACESLVWGEGTGSRKWMFIDQLAMLARSSVIEALLQARLHQPSLSVYPLHHSLCFSFCPLSPRSHFTLFKNQHVLFWVTLMALVFYVTDGPFVFGWKREEEKRWQRAWDSSIHLAFKPQVAAHFRSVSDPTSTSP